MVHSKFGKSSIFLNMPRFKTTWAQKKKKKSRTMVQDLLTSVLEWTLGTDTPEPPRVVATDAHSHPVGDGASSHWLRGPDCCVQEFCEPVFKLLVAWNRLRWEYIYHRNWRVLHIRALFIYFFITFFKNRACGLNTVVPIYALSPTTLRWLSNPVFLSK